MSTRTCKHCGQFFELRAGKPGLIDECWNCAVEVVERTAGVVVWEGKHTPVLITCSQSTATRYRRAHERIGASVSTGCRKAVDIAEAAQNKSYQSASQKDAFYSTRLGEKRKVKL